MFTELTDLQQRALRGSRGSSLDTRCAGRPPPRWALSPHHSSGCLARPTKGKSGWLLNGRLLLFSWYSSLRRLIGSAMSPPRYQHVPSPVIVSYFKCVQIRFTHCKGFTVNPRLMTNICRFYCTVINTSDVLILHFQGLLCFSQWPLHTLWKQNETTWDLVSDNPGLAFWL